MNVMNIGQSGLNASAAALSVIGNNIANAETVGFKVGRAEFGSKTSSTGGSSIQLGSGVSVNTISQQFEQGNIKYTGNSLDLAIKGEGFFKLQNQEGAVSYTRNGQFKINDQNEIVNGNGDLLAGSVVTDTGVMAPGTFTLPPTNNTPKPTSTIAIDANLSSATGVTDRATIPFDATNQDTYTYSTGLTIFDRQGNDHLLNMFITKTGQTLADDNTAAATEWQINMLDKNNEEMINAGLITLTVGDDGKISTVAIDGDSNTEDLIAEIEIKPPYDIGEKLKLDLSAITEYGDLFNMNSITQDGYSSANYIGMEISGGGEVTAKYYNGHRQVMGNITLSKFQNANGLRPISDNQWLETDTSGKETLSYAGNSGLGTLISGSLEGSNVDLSDQLVKLIEVQRSYQANAQVVSAADKISQTLLNMR